MSIASSTTDRPGTTAILNGAFDAVRASPIIPGVFLISTILRIIIPDPFNSLVTIVATSLGVVIAYRALGGEIRTDTSMILRLIMAGITIIIYGVVVLLGLIALVLPGLYVMFRLYLAVPAVMIDGDGPFEGFSKSWQLMDGSILKTGCAIGVIFIFTFILALVLTLSAGLFLLAAIIVPIIGGTVWVGSQAFLYMKLADTNGLPQVN
jgi:hypothetical protein